MKVLMFGWEYPPHVFGGLATANYGISEGLKAQGDMDITLCLPHPFGDESQHACRIVAMNAVPIAYRDVDYDYVKQRVGNIMDPDYYFKLRDHIYADFNYMNVNDLGAMEFAGGYPGNLHEEINNYSIIAGQVARTEEFDIIHAHDWLTFPAGIHAKQVSGKPLCIHVHATDFDRSCGKVNPTVYSIEKNGMDWADCIMCVSELTRQTVINQYTRIPVSATPCTTPFIRCRRSIRTFLVSIIPARRRSLRSSDVSLCRKVPSISLRLLQWCSTVHVMSVSVWLALVI